MEKTAFKVRVRLRHLDCFRCVAETKNLGKAASKLRLTQPAVSKTLTELEDIVGLKLLERNRLGTRLTRDGEAFLVHAASVLDALDMAHASISADTEPKAEAIVMGALPTVAPDLLPAAIEPFRAVHPDARITVQSGTNTALLTMLKSGEIDFALARMADPEVMVGLSFELLYVEPLVLVVRPGHRLIGKPDLTLEDVIACPISVSAKGTVPRHNTESYFQSQGMKMPFNCIETLSVSLARQITRQSDTVWFTPVGAVREDIAEGALAALPLSTKGVAEPVGLLQRSDAVLGPAPKALIAALRDVAALRRK